jgi:hypothetical protein
MASINASTSGPGGIITSGDTSGNLSLQSGGTTVVALTSAGAAVTGTLSATGAANLSSTLTVTGAANLSNTLAVTGAANLSSTLAVTGDLSFNSGYGSAAVAYGCRAWVRFNAQGTLTINASGGVTSVTDNGTGDYTVNFSITFPDANYALAATTDGDTTNGAIAYMLNTSAPTTTTCRLATKLLNGTTFDRDRVMATFTR